MVALLHSWPMAGYELAMSWPRAGKGLELARGWSWPMAGAGQGLAKSWQDLARRLPRTAQELGQELARSWPAGQELLGDGQELASQSEMRYFPKEFAILKPPSRRPPRAAKKRNSLFSCRISIENAFYEGWVHTSGGSDTHPPQNPSFCRINHSTPQRTGRQGSEGEVDVGSQRGQRSGIQRARGHGSAIRDKGLAIRNQGSMNQ